jgi:patatin-related protein
MHGMTKELRKLVVASRAFEEHPFENRFREDETERAYFGALAALADAGTPVRVVIDVISGTSAGGINGVCLAKTLACDGDDGALRDLWLNRGDIGGLLHAPKRLPLCVRLWLIATRLLIRPTSRFTPLRGDDMARWLYDAVETMSPGVDASSGSAADRDGGALVPADESLHLFVTTTDLHGYDRLVESGTGDDPTHDRTYRHVMQFTHYPGRSSAFGSDQTAAIALAARCTSSIPGAFPPVRLPEFAADLAKHPQQGPRRCDLDAITARYFAAYQNLPLPAIDTEFVDGGVLDNAPFDHAINAIANQRAQTEVIRHLIYIEPDPGPDPSTIATSSRTGKIDAAVSGWISTIFAAVMKVSRHEPLLDQLLRLRDLNERIAMIGAIADEQMASVEQVLVRALRDTASPVATTSAPEDAATDPRWVDSIDHERLAKVAANLHPYAAAEAGLANNTYVRLKLQDAVERLATQLAQAFEYPRDSSQATFVRAALSAWVCHQPAFDAPTSSDALRLLGRIDLGYRDRRLRFVVQGVNALYGVAAAPPRGAIDEMKSALWDLLDELAALPSETVEALSPEQTRIFSPKALDDSTLGCDPDRWAGAHDSQLTQLVDAYAEGLSHYTRDSGDRLWDKFQQLSVGWDDDVRLPVAARYIGFPVWDTLIFPIVALSAIPQFSPIRVTRFSPDQAHIFTPKQIPKLKGIAFHHFAAFFHRDWRENDYLWGRLDAVELIHRLLNELEQPARPQASVERDTRTVLQGLAAVLNSETDLTARTTVSLRSDLTDQIQRLTGNRRE